MALTYPFFIILFTFLAEVFSADNDDGSHDLTNLNKPKITENGKYLIGTVLTNSSILLATEYDLFMYTKNMALLSNHKKTNQHSLSARIIELSNDKFLIGDSTHLNFITFENSILTENYLQWNTWAGSSQKIPLLSNGNLIFCAKKKSNKIYMKTFDTERNEKSSYEHATTNSEEFITCSFIDSGKSRVICFHLDNKYIVFSLSTISSINEVSLASTFGSTFTTYFTSVKGIYFTVLPSDKGIICVGKKDSGKSIYNCKKVDITTNDECISNTSDGWMEKVINYCSLDGDSFNLITLSNGGYTASCISPNLGDNSNFIQFGGYNELGVKKYDNKPIDEKTYSFSNFFSFPVGDEIGFAFNGKNNPEHAFYMVVFSPFCEDFSLTAKENSIGNSLDFTSYIKEGYETKTSFKVKVNGADIYDSSKTIEIMKGNSVITGDEMYNLDELTYNAPNNPGEYIITYRGTNQTMGLIDCHITITITEQDCSKFPDCLDCNESACIKCKSGFALKENNCICKENTYLYEKNRQCYSIESKPSKTYLDSSSKLIKDCYDTCLTCTEGGNKDDHKCKSCISGYYKIFSTEICITEDEVYKNSNSKFYRKYYLKENTFFSCDESCNGCKGESKTCIECKENYYSINELSELNPGMCYSKDKAPEGYYPDSVAKMFKECHHACKKCTKGQDSKEQNCDECLDGLISYKKTNGKIRCEFKCTYYFYLDDNENYKCTNEQSCENIGKLKFLNVPKKQCVESCEEDEYLFDMGCYSKCPNGTTGQETSGKKNCVSNDACKKYEYYPQWDLTEILNNVPTIVSSYLSESTYSTKQVNILRGQNDEYILTLFKDEKCYGNVRRDLSMIDLDECPNKLRKHYNIPDSVPLTIAKLSIPRENQNDQISYQFYDSSTGELLSADPCKGEKAKVTVPMNQTKGVDVKQAKEMDKLGVDVYNSSDSFFNDVCFPFTSDSGKDATLKDRRENYYQNVSFCEEGCEYKGVNLTTEEALCECEVKTSFIIDILDNPLTGEFLEMLGNTNFEVIKCYKQVFNKKNFLKNLGGWIIIGLASINIIFAALYFKQGTLPQRVALLQYMENPPISRKTTNTIDNIKSTTSIKRTNFPISRDKSGSSSSNSLRIPQSISDRKDSSTLVLKNGSPMQKTNKGEPWKESSKALKSCLNSSEKVGNPKSSNKILLFFQGNGTSRKVNQEEEEMDDDELNELDLYDAIKYDHRSFCSFYWNQLSQKQDIINTFFIRDQFDSFPLKVFYFVFGIALYFTVNAVFYTESYISQQFQTKEKINVFYLLKNELSRFVYSGIVSMALNIIILYISSAKKRIYVLIKREKKVNSFREKSIRIFQSFHKRAVIFIIVSFICMGLFWYYISAFCYCYLNSENSWLLGGLCTWIFGLCFPFLSCFVIGCFRYIGILCKLEPLYKIAACLSD